MSSSRSVAASGLVALLVSLSVIALIAASGAPPVQLTSSASPSKGAAGSATSTVSQPTGPSVTTSQGQAAGQGVLSVLLTDPPRTPAGVTAIYVFYSDLAVHGPRGWTTIKAAGSIEVMGTVSVGETLASANLPAGSYDAISFDVASALVTYDGANYTAFVQGGQLSVKIEGSSLVSTSLPAAAIIDIQPTVVNVGGASSPKFVLWAEARAFPVPSSQVSSSFRDEGHRISLRGAGWWDADAAKANATLRLSSASLSASSLSLSVADVGSSGTWLKMIVVSGSSLQTGMAGESSVPAEVTGSAVFVVLANGSLVQFRPLLHAAMPDVRGENQSSVFEALLMAGYNMSAGGSASFSYSGAVALSFGLFGSPLGVTAGTTYWVTVIGENTVASTQVTAG